MTDLLPCPFCGGTNLRVGPWIRSSQVVCYACGTRGPEVSWPLGWSVADAPTDNDIALYRAPYDEQARQLWNRRAPSLFGRPIIETDELVTAPIIVGGHWLQPGELLQDAIISALERGLT